MEDIDKKLLSEITDVENGEFQGAYNIRKNGQGIERKVTENINIVTKKRCIRNRYICKRKHKI